MTREAIVTFMNKNTLKVYSVVHNEQYMYLIRKSNKICTEYAYHKIEDMYTIKGCLVVYYGGVQHSYELA